MTMLSNVKRAMLIMLLWNLVLPVQSSRRSYHVSHMYERPIERRRQQSSATTTYKLTTNFYGGTAQYGVMFDISATQKLTITNIDIHTSSELLEDVEVWTKKGSWEGYDNDPVRWYMISCAQLQGAGLYVPTAIPSDAMDWIRIKAGQRMAVYTTLVRDSNGGGGKLTYTSTDFLGGGDMTGDVYAETAHLKYYIGAGKPSQFGNLVFRSRIWNGNLMYVLGHPTRNTAVTISNCRPSMVPSLLPTTEPTLSFEPSSKPTKRPTQSPTQKPTKKPSAKPSRTPTSKPSAGPTSSPTVAPSSKPTSSPTNRPSVLPSIFSSYQPSVAPSPRPTHSPVDYPIAKPSNVPTYILSIIPSEQPTFYPSIAPTFFPSLKPSPKPSIYYEIRPSHVPSFFPSVTPSTFPSSTPTLTPSKDPTSSPSSLPTIQASDRPSETPSATASINNGGILAAVAAAGGAAASAGAGSAASAGAGGGGDVVGMQFGADENNDFGGEDALERGGEEEEVEVEAEEEDNDKNKKRNRPRGNTSSNNNNQLGTIAAATAAATAGSGAFAASEIINKKSDLHDNKDSFAPDLGESQIDIQEKIRQQLFGGGSHKDDDELAFVAAANANRFARITAEQTHAYDNEGNIAATVSFTDLQEYGNGQVVSNDTDEGTVISNLTNDGNVIFDKPLSLKAMLDMSDSGRLIQVMPSYASEDMSEFNADAPLQATPQIINSSSRSRYMMDSSVPYDFTANPIDEQMLNTSIHSSQNGYAIETKIPYTESDIQMNEQRTNLSSQSHYAMDFNKPYDASANLMNRQNTSQYAMGQGIAVSAPPYDDSFMTTLSFPPVNTLGKSSRLRERNSNPASIAGTRRRRFQGRVTENLRPQLHSLGSSSFSNRNESIDQSYMYGAVRPFYQGGSYTDYSDGYYYADNGNQSTVPGSSNLLDYSSQRSLVRQASIGSRVERTFGSSSMSEQRYASNRAAGEYYDDGSSYRSRSGGGYSVQD